MRTIPTETNGLIEIFLASIIFFSPNIFLLWIFKANLFVLMLYEFIIIYLLTTALTNAKYYKKKDNEEKILIEVAKK